MMATRGRYTVLQTAAMLPATRARGTSTIARPLCWPRSASTRSTTVASASGPAAAAGAAALIRRRTAASAASAAAAAPRRHLSSSSPTSAANSATASTATHAQNSSSSANPEGLSTLGTLFFGGLCAATLGLGCWQSVRYFEKVDQMQVREDELRAAPVDMTRFTAAADSNKADGNDASDKQGPSSTSSSSSFRRLVTRGTFDHGREVLVGPRGPPPGALSSSGPSSGRSSGGMSSSPQGYYVVTPLRIAGGGGDGSSNNSNTILVNRGWVPMSYVKRQSAGAGTWSRPRGVVTVVGVETLTERPKFLSPVHDQRTPNMLLWMDRGALEERTGTGAGKGAGAGAGRDGGDGQHRHPLLLTETAETAETTDDSAADGSADAPPPPPPPPTPTFPVRPTAETVGEFKVTPATHAGYAVTWFGLSGAGMIMTRKLLTRGR